MAQTLKEGSSYSLITKEENYEKRQVYFVKLTDSCLKAIEEHSNAGLKIKPIIRFDGQNGFINIPSKTNQDVERKFNFAVSNVLHSDNNPLQECIKQQHSSSNQLISYGPLDQKISIAATGDSFENTRNRMALVEQERKDIRTKEVKFSNVKKGRKSQPHMVTPVGGPPSKLNTKAAPPDTHKVNAIKNPKKINPIVKQNSPKPIGTSNNHAPQVVKKSPIISSKKSPTSTLQKSSPGIGINFTCRERVIHILGLRPHKKHELVTRLQREAMSQKDRNNVTMVLQQVTTLRENQYSLLPQFYASLKVDSWPFYSESEKLIVKRNVVTNKMPDQTSPQVVSSTSKSPEEKLGKRPLEVNNIDHTIKKKKIEHNEEPSSTSISPSKISPPKIEEKCKKVSAISTQPSKENIAQGEESPQTVASTSDSPEYLSYKPITTREQRFQYKRDFQLEYPEYLTVKKNLDAITTKFMELDRSWRRTDKGSPDYLRIQDEIMTAYNRQQQDEKYHKMKLRCEELHQKLSHIKKLVVEYDNHMVNS